MYLRVCVLLEFHQAKSLAVRYGRNARGVAASAAGLSSCSRGSQQAYLATLYSYRIAGKKSQFHS